MKGEENIKGKNVIEEKIEEKKKRNKRWNEN